MYQLYEIPHTVWQLNIFLGKHILTNHDRAGGICTCFNHCQHSFLLQTLLYSLLLCKIINKLLDLRIWLVMLLGLNVSDYQQHQSKAFLLHSYFIHLFFSPQSIYWSCGKEGKERGDGEAMPQAVIYYRLHRKLFQCRFLLQWQTENFSLKFQSKVILRSIADGFGRTSWAV